MCGKPTAPQPISCCRSSTSTAWPNDEVDVSLANLHLPHRIACEALPRQQTITHDGDLVARMDSRASF